MLWQKKVATCCDMLWCLEKKVATCCDITSNFVDMSSNFCRHVVTCRQVLIRLDQTWCQVSSRLDQTLKTWSKSGCQTWKNPHFLGGQILTFFQILIKKKHKKNLVFLVSMENRILGEYFFCDWKPGNSSFCGKWCSFGPKNVKNVPVHLFFFKHLPQPKKSTLKKAA
jgi:hypothetical protein